MAKLSEIEKIAKAAAMAGDNGYTNGLDGCSYIAYVANEPIVFNEQSSLKDEDDLYIAVYEAEKVGGWVVACNGNVPARLFSNMHKAMVFYYRLLVEVDNLKSTELLYTYENNNKIYQHINQEVVR